MPKEEFYDRVIHVAMVNLYTLSKDTKKIVINYVDGRNKSHRALIKIAQKASTVFGFKCYVNLSPIQYLIFRIQTHAKWCKRGHPHIGFDIETFIDDLETANKYPRLFEELYAYMETPNGI